MLTLVVNIKNKLKNVTCYHYCCNNTTVKDLEIWVVFFYWDLKDEKIGYAKVMNFQILIYEASFKIH